MDDSFISHLHDVGEEEYLIRMERPVIVRVAEVRNLPKGISGTWVEIVAEDRSVGRTPTKFKEKNPFFGEDIEFTLLDEDLYLSVILWKEGTMKKSNIFKKNTEVGRVCINIDETKPGDNWYTLDVRKGGKGTVDIRMSIQYHEITILPSHKYTRLLNMLLDKSSEFKVIMLLSTGRIKSKEAIELAELLVKIGDVMDIAPDIINALLTYDIHTADSKETLFRGNSVGTKAFDFYMKHLAIRWLDSLRPLVQSITAMDRNCEARDGKINPEDDVEENLKNLEELFDAATKVIFSSVHQCPLPLRKICHHIRKEVQVVFKEDEDVGYTSITGFIFLRFFVPAIMTPKLFGLAGDYSTGNTERTFILVATLLQKVANLQIFDHHEAHFDRLNPIIFREHAKLREFVDFLCESPDPSDPEAITVKVPVDLDLMVARLCRHIADHLTPLEKALPAKYVALFLGELEVVFDEMKFLWKKFKNDQSKKRTIRDVNLVNSAPAAPVRERLEKAVSVRDKTDQAERVKRRHSFSLDRLGIVKSHGKVRDKTGTVSENVSRANSRNDLTELITNCDGETTEAE